MINDNQDDSRAAESPAVQSLEQERLDKDRAKKNGTLQEAVEDTFPASDPVSMTNPITSGAPEE